MTVRRRFSGHIPPRAAQIGYVRKRSAVLILLLSLLKCLPGQQYAFPAVPGAPKNPTLLFQDSRGRLWLGGEQLACFDGTRFFFLRDYGFPAATALDIAEDAGGAIWIGADSGVYRFSEGRVQQLAKGVAVSVIAGSADTAVAAIGPPGNSAPESTDLVRIQRKDGKWNVETVVNLDSPGPLTIDWHDTILYPWTTTGWGEIRFADIVRWRAGTQLAVAHFGARGQPVNGRWQVLGDRYGCRWGSAPQHTNYNCGDGSHYVPFAGASTGGNVHESADGSMVVWGPSLLAVGRPGRFQVATRANGLPGVQDAIRTRDGTIWIASGTGLYRFASPFQLEYWTIREGLADPPWSIARAGKNVYAGMDRRIAVLGADRQRWNTIAAFQDGGLVTALSGTPDGNVLASFVETDAKLISKDGAVLARTGKNHPISGLMRLGEADGETWLSGITLGRIRRAGPVLEYEDHPLRHSPAGNVLAVKYEPRTRKLWSCYNGGLIERDPRGNWREYTTADGLKTDGCWSLAPLPNGDIWYAYYGVRAFARIRPLADGRLAVHDYEPPAVADSEGTTFDVDRDGRLWRTGELGVYVADPAQAEAAAWLKLDQSDGLPANDMNSGSVFADADGSMWWGADNDLAHYTPPPDLVGPRIAPQVFISAFSWDNQPPRLAEATESLPHGSRVVAHIGSLQFDRRNALRLRYRVLPEQPDWRETGNLDLALGPLSAGGHTLEVEGRLFTGPWSPAASRYITVLRPVWLAWPFLAAYLMMLPSAAAGGYLLKRRRQAEQKQLLPDLGAWRMGALLPEGQPGTTLGGRFEVHNLLARGGFANVMDGFDRDRRERCAIKIFRGEVSDVKDRAWIEHRFEQEIAALERIRHPHVVAIYAHGTAPAGVPYLVMEFVEGRSLREVLDAGPLPPKRAAAFLRQLAGALDAIHGERICHRDVKPENLIIRGAGSADESIVLIDFSIAIVKDANETLHGVSRAAGTFAYMAPEQAVGYAEPSSDIYSLSKVVIEMIAGRKLADMLPQPTIDLPRCVPELLKGLDAGLSEESIAMLAVALSFDPSRRPNSAGAFVKTIIQDLERE